MARTACPQWLVIVPKPGPDPLLHPSSFSETPTVTKDEHAANSDPPSCTSYTAENESSRPVRGRGPDLVPRAVVATTAGRATLLYVFIPKHAMLCEHGFLCPR